MTRQWALKPRIVVIALLEQGQEAVEITGNFHGLLHSFTFVALSTEVNY
jgi:hypothetical protein